MCVCLLSFCKMLKWSRKYNKVDTLSAVCPARGKRRLQQQESCIIDLVNWCFISLALKKLKDSWHHGTRNKYPTLAQIFRRSTGIRRTTIKRSAKVQTRRTRSAQGVHDRISGALITRPDHTIPAIVISSRRRKPKKSSSPRLVQNAQPRGIDGSCASAKPNKLMTYLIRDQTGHRKITN